MTTFWVIRHSPSFTIADHRLPVRRSRQGHANSRRPAIVDLMTKRSFGSVRQRPDGRWDAEYLRGSKRVVQRDLASEDDADSWLERERGKQNPKGRRSRTSTWGTVLLSSTGYRVRHPRPDGGPPVNRPERFEFKRDADAFLADLRVQAGKGLLKVESSDETVLEFATSWLGTATVRGSTHDKYAQYVARYIAPVPALSTSTDGRARQSSPYLSTSLAHVPLRKLTADQVGMVRRNPKRCADYGSRRLPASVDHVQGRRPAREARQQPVRAPRCPQGVGAGVAHDPDPGHRRDRRRGAGQAPLGGAARRMVRAPAGRGARASGG